MTYARNEQGKPQCSNDEIALQTFTFIAHNGSVNGKFESGDRAFAEGSADLSNFDYFLTEDGY
ncbi:hypothetical protein C7B76_10625 [filamentous cyanobacterium CCP2]|nr:hypothetical protein C7B76_10625 [filamentous cyanobacterium CCP2]